MANWILRCTSCQIEFVHSKSENGSLLNFLLPAKPSFEPDTEFTCPHCGETGKYSRSDLRYSS